MAEDLENGEFWLPSEFLTDDILMEKENRRGFENESKVCFPYEFPYGFDSGESALSSPVESVVGSNETESDEEQDYMAGLSRQMAQSMLLDEEKFVWNDNPKKTKVLAGSPQSTLCEVGSWMGCSNGSSRASSKGTSQVSSPPTTPMDQKDDAWDLLYAAAGQVVKMNMNNKGWQSQSQFQSQSHGQGLLGPPRKPAPAPVSAPIKAPSAGYYSNEALAHLQMQQNQFQLLKKQQLVKQQQFATAAATAWGRQVKVTPNIQQQFQNRTRAGGFGNGRCGRSMGLSSSAWSIPQPQQQQQQQQAGSGMRAVFLEGTGSKRESSGTGVFIPRRVGNPTEFRKKPACSTVLVPARVAQALKLNLDEMGSTHSRFQGRIVNDQEARMAQQKRTNRPHPTTAGNYEIRLPQEWTY